MLSEAGIWNKDSDSEPQLDIQNQSNCAETDSDEEPLFTKCAPTAQKRKTISPIKIVPDQLSITFGDKTSVIVKSKNQVARKTVMRRVKEPRGTFKPLCNIIPDGTIKHYTPHTITMDKPKRKDTVIRKSDIAIATETTPNKTRLINFVACKTVGKCKRNREKIKKLYLDEKNKKGNWQRNKQKNNKTDPNRAQASKPIQAKTMQPKETPQQSNNDKNNAKEKQGAPEGKLNNPQSARTSHTSTPDPLQ